MKIKNVLGFVLQEFPTRKSRLVYLFSLVVAVAIVYKVWGYIGIGQSSLPSNLTVTGRLQVSLSSGFSADRYRDLPRTCLLIAGGNLSTENLSNLFASHDHSQPIAVSYKQSVQHTSEECPNDFTFMMSRMQLEALAKAKPASPDETAARVIGSGIITALPLR
jgi:hypothetical protein